MQKWNDLRFYLSTYTYLFIFRLSKVSSQNLEVINLDSWPWASSLTGFPPSLFDLGIPCIWVYTVLNNRNSSFERLWMQFHCAFFSVDKICKNRQIKSWKSAINKLVLQTAAVRQARSEAWRNKTAFPLKYLNFELCVHETIKTKHILTGRSRYHQPSAVRDKLQTVPYKYCKIELWTFYLVKVNLMTVISSLCDYKKWQSNIASIKDKRVQVLTHARRGEVERCYHNVSYHQFVTHSYLDCSNTCYNLLHSERFLCFKQMGK